MNPKLTHILPSLAVGGLLLALGVLAAISSARARTEVEAAALVALESETVAGEEAPARQHKRRTQASLAMPYFSFGQSLRPRS